MISSSKILHLLGEKFNYSSLTIHSFIAHSSRNTTRYKRRKYRTVICI